jgi:hypothetical protein
LPAWRCFWPVRFDYSYDPNFPDNVTSIVPRNLSTGQQDFDWQAWRYDYYQAGSPPAGSLFHVYRGRSDGTGQVWGQSGGGLGEVWGQSWGGLGSIVYSCIPGGSPSPGSLFHVHRGRSWSAPHLG